MSPGNDGERIVMAFELPPLPFPKNALEPYTSAKTLEFHHGKHHQTYVNTLNELIEGMPIEQFGSGWAWLVADKGKLKIAHTLNGVDPVALGQTALLTCDVWEHAYYLDYQNRRPDFVEAFLDHLVNWDFVGQNLTKVKAR